MFTICMFIFGSVVAVDPVAAECVRATQAQVTASVATCKALDKDPLTTCEVERMGALKYFIRVRHLEGT